HGVVVGVARRQHLANGQETGIRCGRRQWSCPPEVGAVILVGAVGQQQVGVGPAIGYRLTGAVIPNVGDGQDVVRIQSALHFDAPLGGLRRDKVVRRRIVPGQRVWNRRQRRYHLGVIVALCESGGEGVVGR